MSSQIKEVATKEATEDEEIESEKPSACGHTQFLLDSLSLPEPSLTDLELCLESIIDLLTMPGVNKYRKEVNKVSEALARAVIRTKTERPVLFFAQILQKFSPAVKRPATAYRLARFAAAVAIRLRLLKKQPGPKEELKKEIVIERRQARAQSKREEASLLISEIESLLSRLDYVDEKMLGKIEKTISPIASKAEIKADPALFSGESLSQEALMKVFFLGLTKVPSAEIRGEILRKLMTSMLTKEGLLRSEHLLKFYRPLLRTCGEAEIEKILAPQLLFLIKRSKDELEWVAPVLNSLGKLTCQSFATLIRTTLSDLLVQELSTQKLRETFLATVQSLDSCLIDSADPNKFALVLAELSHPWKQLMGASEVESGKQLNFIRVLITIFRSTKKCTDESKKAVLGMIIELFGAVKQDHEASEAAVAIAELALSDGLCPAFYDLYTVNIIQKALVAAKSKEVMADFLLPIVVLGLRLLAQHKEMSGFLPAVTKSAWKAQVAQLNLNAVTQSGYNMAVLALYFLLDRRDQQTSNGKEEEKSGMDPALLKYVTGPQSSLNRRDFISQKQLVPLEGLLHIHIVTLTALIYPVMIDLQSALPLIANALLQYAFSPKQIIRTYATACVKNIHAEYLAKPDLAFNFAKLFQMATFAFVKHASGKASEYAPYIKKVLSILLHMFSTMKGQQATEQVQLFFLRLFILMHSSKANGNGVNKRNLCNQLWSRAKKLEGVPALLAKIAPSILRYMTSGNSLMSPMEGALVSTEQVQTTTNIIVTLARQGLGKEVMTLCGQLLTFMKLESAEKLYEKVAGESADEISHFEVEFLVEEIQDLKTLAENAIPKKPEEKKDEKKPVAVAPKSAAGTKKTGGKKNAAKTPTSTVSKEEREKENRKVLDTYVKNIVGRVRTEVKSGLHFLRVLCAEWNTKEFAKEVIELGILEEVKEITRIESTRFDGYITLRKLLGCLTKDYLEDLSESYFASIIQATSRKYVKSCKALFESLAQTKADIFDPSFIAIALDIADYLIDTPALSSSIKSKSLEVVIRILLETPYSRPVIHKVTPIAVKLLKSTYQCDNLAHFLQVFWTRATFNDMQDVMRNLCNYDLSHQLTLVRAVVAVKRPLPGSSWLSNALLQCLFSESHDMSSLAKSILNDHTLCLQEVLIEDGAPSGLAKALNFRATDIRDSAVRSISGYLEICTKEMPVAIELFIKQFNGLDTQCRGAIADMIKATAHIMPTSELKAVFNFLLTKGVVEANGSSKEFMESGIQVIQEQGKAHAGTIIGAIEELLNQGKKVLSDNANTIAVIFIGNVARYLAKEDPKLPKLYKTLQGMLAISSETVSIAVAKCIGYFACIFQEEAKEKLTSILSEVQKMGAKSLMSADKMRSQAFALAGCIKGLGIKAIEEYHVLNVLAEPYNEKADTPINTAKREFSLHSYAALSHTLGKIFEFYSVECMPHILQSFAAGKETIRYAALHASKAIISKLSGQGVKSILPILISKLGDSNWRSKLAAVECLGSMAFMAPKQLSNHLPKIVANIKGVLNDTQPKVHEAGIQALTAIGSVIKSPEIADISGKIIQTLKNPTRDLIFALDLLLQQSFAHAVDAPSLSLIIPILDYGLRAQNNEVKRKATQLVGSICKLISDPNDMLPYMDVVMPALQSALFDPIPEVRSASAKALGSLCKGLGLENMQDTIVWLKSILHKESSPVERSGAAQGYAEIIAEQGTGYLEGIIEQLIEHTRDKAPNVREGYIGLFLFLPLSFGDAFEKYFTVILPVVLEALTDADESVRGTANRVVQICIRQYGKRRTDVLLEPLLQRMLDSKWKIRESALTLMADLLVTIEGDMTRSKPQFISLEDRDNIFATLFLLRYDHVESIRVTAAQIWKGVIDNQPRTLKAIMPTLITAILELVAKRGPELREIGIFTLHDLAERYGEKLTADILTTFKQKLEIETEGNYAQGIAICLYEMLSVLDSRIVTEIKTKIYNMLEPFIYTDEDELRNIIASTFATIMNKDLDNNFQHQFSKLTCTKLLEFEEAGDTEKPEFLQEMARLIVKQRQKFGDDLIHILSEDPLTPIKIATFGKLMKYLVSVIFSQHRSKKLLERLFKELLTEGKVQDATVACFQRCSESIQDEDDRGRWVTQILEFVNVTDKNIQRIRTFLKIVVHMFGYIKEPVYIQFSKDMFDVVVTAIDFEYAEIPILVTQAIDAITKLEAKENQHTFVSRIKREIDAKKKGKRDYLLPIFNREKALDYLLPLFQNTLMHASVEFRVDAAAAYRYTIELTAQTSLKDYAAKIAGSLIRVVNDKFPFPLKCELLECTAALMKKCGGSIKAFVSPLQTTMIKAVNDPELSAQLRPVILRNVTELLKLNPKTDSLRSELVATINSPIITTHATAFSVLAMIGKIHGAGLKPELRTPLFTQAATYLSKLTAPFDENTLLAISFALSNLCHTIQEANMLLDLPLKKYEGKPEIAAYLLYSMLFMPYANFEPGSKFISGLAEKMKVAEKVNMEKAIGYAKFFISGICPPALDLFLGLVDIWVSSTDFVTLDWESAKPQLEEIPFFECESVMKATGERYVRAKCAVLRYLAKQCEVELKDGAKDIAKTMFDWREDIQEEIKKLEETKGLDHKAVMSLLRLLKY